MKKEIVDLFHYLADNAESYGAENLYLARREEGYVGDPKEFRFSEIYGRRFPTYKYELLVDYITEAERVAHERLRRRLTSKEAEWMQREASRLYAEDRALYKPVEQKTAAQLDEDIAAALRQQRRRKARQ